MGKEIERKFLVKGVEWRKNVRGSRYIQGYLALDPGRTVRVRMAENIGYLTVKGISTGIVRHEFEYIIPAPDAAYMLEHLCLRPLIEKNRYRVEYQGVIWEIDEFLGANKGLVIAEIELDREDRAVALPEWVGREVSGETRYFNASLVMKPWTTWSD